MILFTLLFLVLIFPVKIFAIYNPTGVPNNKFGIHVADINDIADTAVLVNSNGGDWGYVTMVMQDNDHDFGKWQNIFNQMRRLHLIPIVRLATHPQGNYWIKPEPVDAQPRAQFLNSLNWPIENRYVVLFNEPNHAKEWGNEIDPEGYAEIFVAYAQGLKSASQDFFILPAGFDASATTTSDTLDAGQFINRVVEAKPEIRDLIDGWTSHSYPNPAFSGSPYASGKGTIRSYLWELEYVRILGFTKNLPVFITETGWVNTIPTGTVSKNLLIASSAVWQDPVITAVTPFVFSYQGKPFDNFSWKKLGSSEFYPHYFDYQNLPKGTGAPQQHHTFSILDSLLPDTLVASSNYTLEMRLQNTGQAIIGEKEGYTMSLSAPGGFKVVFDSIPTFEPGETVTIGAKLSTPDFLGTHLIKLSFLRGNKQFPIEEKSIELIPPPALSINLKLGWRGTSSANDVTVLVYDGDTLIHKFTGLAVVNGHVEVDGLTDIIPGNRYRVVTIVPFYLPRQTILPLTSDTTALSFKRFLPFDLNRDGTLNVSDLVTLAKSKPHDVLPRFFAP